MFSYAIIERNIKDLAMNFLEAVTTCLTDKYFKSSGRAQLPEFWWFALFSFILFGLAAALDNLADPSKGATILSIAIKLLLTLPYIAVTIRRLHDTNKSGWYYFVVLIPLAGFIILLYFCALKGTVGPNRFGPDPLNPEVVPNPEVIPTPEDKIE
jgi:uncharacterized membrane protein YhaH (DUF805 family)